MKQKLITQITHTLMLILVSGVTALPLFLTGCISGESIGLASTKSEAMRVITPRPLRQQTFSNTPTYYNQGPDNYENRANTWRDLLSSKPTNKFHTDKQIVVEKDSGDSYGRGFQDGCDTYNATMGAGVYRLVKTKFDTDAMVNDPWYLRGFQDANEFCTFRHDWDTH